MKRMLIILFGILFLCGCNYDVNQLLTKTVPAIGQRSYRLSTVVRQ